MTAEVAPASVHVLFVCLGNICRSPTAQGVFVRLVRDAGLEGRVVVWSAGTSGHHEGAPPDRRTQWHAAQRGYDLSAQRARLLGAEDLARADYVLAMDRANLEAIWRVCPREHRSKVRLFLDFVPESEIREVPDPYYGGAEGFQRVLDLVEAGARGLLEHLRQKA